MIRFIFLVINNLLNFQLDYIIYLTCNLTIHYYTIQSVFYSTQQEYTNSFDGR